MKHGMLGTLCAATLLAGCGSSSNDSPAKQAGLIDRFEVISTVDAYGGATPAGAAGPYQVVTGIVHGKIAVNAPENAGIVDLANAPVDADGYVSYTTDVVLLRPKNPLNAKRVLFYDVVNRGNKLGQGAYIGGGALVGGTAPDPTFPTMLANGYTVVWSGWQNGIAQTGNGALAAIGVSFPTATNKDGSPITELAREEFVPDFAGGSPTTIALTYPPASQTDLSEVVFTARQTWANSAGLQDYKAPSVPVTSWTYTTDATGSVSVSFTPPASVPGAGGVSVAADAGTIYEFVYRAKNPTVNGIGFAAVRDLVSFLRRSDKDNQGNANPLNDMKTAPCATGIACGSSPSTNFDVAIGEGISQSGRFLRDFLYQGFNKDIQGNKVFDGLMPIIPASRKTWTNVRFSQIGRWSKGHEDHFMPGDQFPFAYNVIADPVTGATDGILQKCTANNTCPKIMQLDGGYEWWGGRASLVVTDGAGRDLILPDNVRYYLVAGTQHNGGAGVTSGILTVPAAGSLCQLPGSPVAQTPVVRALIPAMEKWVTQNIAPPASQYPTATSSMLATSDAIGFPNLSGIVIPTGTTASPTTLNFTYSGIYNQLFAIDYTKAVPVVDLAKQYRVLMPRVDTNGNELAGILVPDVKVPLATYTGWNLRGAGHAIGEACTSNGAAIPFAVDATTRSATDKRVSLADLYSSRTDYKSKVTAAANALVAQGYLLQLDATNVYSKNASSISSALISNP